MKKILFCIMFTFGIAPAIGQTNFRPITYAEGIAAAKNEDKLIFIDFFTEWCGPCKLMSEEIFPQPIVGDFLNRTFICMKFNAEKGEGKTLAKQFNVIAYPTFIIVDTNERVIGKRTGSFLNEEEFVSTIKRIIDPEKTPERMKQRYDEGERSADLILSYAEFLLESARELPEPNQSQIDQALKIVNEYFHGLTDSQKVAKENSFIYLKFSQSITDEYGRYMITHRENFAPEIKDEINNLLKNRYNLYFFSFLTGLRPYNKADYEIIKTGIINQGLNKNNEYNPLFHLIESYAAGDMDAFLDTCEQEYPNLNAETKRDLISGLKDLLTTNNSNVLKRAVEFIRSRLAEMPVDHIPSARMVISQLEARISK